MPTATKHASKATAHKNGKQENGKRKTSSIHLNDHVLVSLTGAGHEVLNTHFATELRDQYEVGNRQHRFSVRELMQLFGPSINGTPLFEDDRIEIDA